jgi:hypothetical protein
MPSAVRNLFRGYLNLSTKRIAKLVLFAAAIAIASITLGGPAVAAMKLGTAQLAQLANSTEFEASFLAVLGAVFLIVASAVRKLQASAKQSV